MLLGIDHLLKDPKRLEFLKSKKVALMCHMASVTGELTYTAEALQAAGVDLSCIITPQHGFWGLEQANMVETKSGKDSFFNLPFISIYSEKRNLSKQELDQFDVLLVDLQDVGCRVYTYLTSLGYCLEACAKASKKVWVLDRPNPAGRFIEGNLLASGFESFVGLGPVPLRHGMTLAELALWYEDKLSLKPVLEVIPMKDYNPSQSPWPSCLTWVNPSPNMPQAKSALFYPGTVLLEATTVSEGRGSTRPLEWFGAPHIEPKKVVADLKIAAGTLMEQFDMRAIGFRPTFDKHSGDSCWGFELTEKQGFEFSSQSYRLICMFLASLKRLYPDQELLIPPPYEYVEDLSPLDIITGSDFVRQWLESPASFAELDAYFCKGESSWDSERKPFLLYP